MYTPATANAQQRAAIESRAALQYIIAGPGSGKTFTLVSRIVQGIEAGELAPEKVCLFTFTNAGAKEFNRRIASQTNKRLGYAGTLHGFCLRLLQRHGHRIGYRKGGVSIVVMPERDREKMIEAARDAIGLKKKVSMAAILGKGEVVLDEQQRHYVGLVWAAYRERLKLSNMVDYDGILAEGAKLVGLPVVREECRFDLVAMDEAQDSGEADWRIFDGLAARWKVVVGDPDQSIYVFRGGRPELLVSRAEHSNTWTILEQNYRSQFGVLQAANSLIRYNDDRVRKDCLTDTQGGKVQAFSFDDDINEAVGIALWLRKRHTYTPYHEMAVLCRTNQVAKKLRFILPQYGVPIMAEPITQQPEGWQLALAYVSLCLDPTNDHYAGAVFASFKNLASAKRDALIAKQPLAEFLHFEVPPLADLPRHLRIAGCSAPSAAIVEGLIENTLSPDSSYAELLAAMVEPREPSARPPDDTLEITTIHGAKGREWDYVVIAGCEEGTFPSTRSPIEEERRLAFVAITRARKEVLMTMAEMRTGEQHWETRRDLQPSRFIGEAGIQVEEMEIDP